MNLSIAGCKRGRGTCKNCKREYANRCKPKFCDCGFELGGTYEASGKKRIVADPSSVNVYSTPKCCLRSVRVSQNNDRNFVFINDKNKICYARKCLDLRASFVASACHEDFTCKHINLPSKDFIYSTKFTELEIEAFSPDVLIQNEMKEYQSLDDDIPTIVKVTEVSYAVRGPTSPTLPIDYVHVFMKEGNLLKCMGNDCKKSGKINQIPSRSLCIHLLYVLLAREIKERNNSGCVQEKLENKGQLSQSFLKTLEIQKKKTIPYKIPQNIINKGNHIFRLPNKRFCFYPEETNCGYCRHVLSEPMFQQGTSTDGGNGYLITNMTPFLKIDIKQKKCLNKDCNALTVLFPYERGLFNASNKVLVGLDILVEWRNYLKRGVAISVAIKGKLEALLAKIDEADHPSYGELDYLATVLYNAFFGFEMMTERDLNDVICGYCGIVGQIYYGDSDEKNCSSLRGIKSKPERSGHKESSTRKESNSLSGEFMDIMRTHMLERCTYSSSRLSFEVDYDKVPLLMPSMQQNMEINTEAEKQSSYNNKNINKCPGDPIMLSKIMKTRSLSFNDIDDLTVDEMSELAKHCGMVIENKSTNHLRADIRHLYSSILTGESRCREFNKVPGQTGGFYNLVCSHGTTVCSKFMVLRESVRDAADLWLSLKHPPVLFISDTPCTFVQHVNNRCPDTARQYWGTFDGCFEEPSVEKRPTSGIDVPSIIPTQFQQNSQVSNDRTSSFIHPLSGEKRRYVCGDTFHTNENPHKSKLCLYHDVDLALQASTIKRTTHEPLTNRKRKLRNRSSSSLGFLHHYFYNYLMNYYDNEEIVKKQKADLESAATKRKVSRDKFMRFVIL